MKRSFRSEAAKGFKLITSGRNEIITEKDLEHLPDIVKKYLELVKVKGREKVFNMKVHFRGRIRMKPEEKWMKFKARQYSFFYNPTRLFYLKALRSGIPATGLHIYKNVAASMVIKIAGLFKITDVKGEEMNQAETVTYFNDMCLMAPATLIDKNISWEVIDLLAVRANFTNEDITITAELYFNEQGELTNFISYDRYDLSNPESPGIYPFSTPVEEYKEFNGFRLPCKAKAIWHRPQADFCYGEFIIKDINYNCSK